MKFCPKCGTQAVDDAVFCAGCGNRFEAPQPVAAPVAPVAPAAPVVPVQQPYAEPAYTAPVASAYAAPVMPQPQPSNTGKMVAIIAAIVVALAAIGGGVWYFFLREDDKADDSKKESTSQTGKTDTNTNPTDNGDSVGDNTDNTFVGDWKVMVSNEAMLDVMNISTGADAEIVEALRGELDMNQEFSYMIFTFNEDGSAAMKIDEDGLREYFNAIMPAMVKVQFEYQAAQYGMSVEELLAESGYSSMDQAVSQSLGQVDAQVNNIVTSFEQSMAGKESTYKVEGGKLVLGGAENSEADFEFDGDDTVMLTNLKGADEDNGAAALAAMGDLKLVRVK